MKPAIDALTALGLNQLEAEVYEHLLRTEPMTGYRIGKAIGKPTANVYKAMDALAGLGAVLLEEGEHRVCRAVPAEEFLAHRRRALLGDVERAAAVLPSRTQGDTDQAIYQIRSVPLALERARAMLDRCTRIAVVDAFPGPLAEIRDSMRRAVDRGVALYLLTYEPEVLAGANVVCVPPPVGGAVLRHWRSQQLNLTTDGTETLVALLSQDLTQVHQAVWSESLYLASILHAGMMKEHALHEIGSVQHQDDALARIREILARQRYFHNTDVPGQRRLLARFGAVDEGENGS